MQKANLIIRGFLFKKDRVQGCDSENWWKYDINFLNVMPGYLRLIKLLSKKYELSTYFSCYDTTPSRMVAYLKSAPTVKEMFFCSEKGSGQFTTMHNALEKCSKDLTFVIRSDLIIKKKMIKVICDFDYELDTLYAFSHEKCPTGIKDDNIIDVFHVASGEKINVLLHEKFLKQWSNLHHLHKRTDVEYMIPHDESGLPCVEYIDTYKNEFWEIYRQIPYSYLYEYGDFNLMPTDWAKVVEIAKIAREFND